MKEINEINKKEEFVCSEAIQHEKTIEDELRWARIRIEELINERNTLFDKVNREEAQKDVLIDCLAKEHEQRIRAYEQIDWHSKRTDAYRSAINEIAEKCHEVLKTSANTSKSVEQLAKEIFDVTYRF